MVRVGVSVRFLATVEGRATLRVGDRSGTVPAACEASGGKALLAFEPVERRDRLYRSRSGLTSGQGLTEAQFDALLAELDLVRTRGYAINNEATEPGVAALGVAIVGTAGRPVAALSVSVPSHRVADLQRRPTVRTIFAARDHVQSTLAEAGFEPG